jgi:hypothetical protein
MFQRGESDKHLDFFSVTGAAQSVCSVKSMCVCVCVCVCVWFC